ncbi:hypothetical protein OFB79_26050, partial [Escherichia coli]|nr:hypothetical protein [Escherichia coli]
VQGFQQFLGFRGTVPTLKRLCSRRGRVRVHTHTTYFLAKRTIETKDEDEEIQLYYRKDYCLSSLRYADSKI